MQVVKFNPPSLKHYDFFYCRVFRLNNFISFNSNYYYFAARIAGLKKILTILFLLIHTMNILGAQLFFSLAEKFSDQQMTANLDENKYNESDLIQLRLPLNIPYTTDRKDYERCDGNIVINGIHYNYVKRIVYNDTIYLYCIPNLQRTALNSVKNEFASRNADLPVNKKNDQPGANRNGFMNEYNVSLFQYNFLSLSGSHCGSYFSNNDNTSPGFIDYPVQPPDRTA